jgi:hypothetical protein
MIHRTELTWMTILNDLYFRPWGWRFTIFQLHENTVGGLRKKPCLLIDPLLSNLRRLRSNDNSQINHWIKTSGIVLQIEGMVNEVSRGWSLRMPESRQNLRISWIQFEDHRNIADELKELTIWICIWPIEEACAGGIKSQKRARIEMWR